VLAPVCAAFLAGPTAMAASRRGAEARPARPAATKEVMQQILATCRKHKVAAGVHTTSPEEAKMRIAEGWQFIAITSELKMMLDGAAAVLRGLGGSYVRGDLAKY